MWQMHTWLMVPSMYEVGNLLLIADGSNCSMWFIRYTQFYITHSGNIIVTSLCPNSAKRTDMLSWQTCSHKTHMIEKNRIKFISTAVSCAIFFLHSFCLTCLEENVQVPIDIIRKIM